MTIALCWSVLGAACTTIDTVLVLKTGGSLDTVLKAFIVGNILLVAIALLIGLAAVSLG